MLRLWRRWKFNRLHKRLMEICDKSDCCAKCAMSFSHEDCAAHLVCEQAERVWLGERR